MAERGQVCADVVGLGDPEAGVERQGMLPVQAGQAMLACCVVRVSETGVGAGLLVPVARLDGQSECGAVLGASLLGLSRGVPGFPDAVECLGFAVAVAGLAEDGESPPQIVGRPLVATLAQINDTEIGQCVTFGYAVASLAEEDEGLPQNVARLLAATLAQVDDAEIGQCVSFADATAGLAIKDKCLPVTVGSLLVATLPPADEVEIAQRIGFANRVACFAIASERLQVVFGSLLVAAPPPVDKPKMGQRAGFAAAVAGLAEEGQGPPVVLGGLFVAALPQVNDTEIGQGVGFGGAVTRLAGGLPGVGMDAQRVGEVGAGVEVTEQRSSQPDGVPRPAVGGGVRADGDQVRSFGIQPGKCGTWIGH